MPEYLSPGVYVEEVSFRAKSIQGVATSTTGFAGMTQYGPVQYPNGPKTTEPRLVGSVTEYQRTYGDLTPLEPDTGERLGYMGLAVKSFFDNGGTRLYISRVFAPKAGPPLDWGVASFSIPVSTGAAVWRARWPGFYGNVVVGTSVTRSKNIAFQSTQFGAAMTQVKRAKNGAVVEIYDGAAPPVGNAPLDITKLAVLQDDLVDPQKFIGQGGAVVPSATAVIQLVELTVTVSVTTERTDVYDSLGADPAQKRYISKILQADNPEDEDCVVWLDWDPTTITPADPFLAARLMLALQSAASSRLAGGHDGTMPSPVDGGDGLSLQGMPANPDDPNIKATGLEALGEIPDIAIIALPDGGTYDDATDCQAAAEVLISNAEALKYRFAIVDPPDHLSLSEIRAFRAQFDTEYAAVYYPWIETLDPTQRPTQGAPPPRITLPPSGFMAGIYGRVDDARGVWKAPANEVVNGLTRFETNVTKTRQDVLNPEGINAFRFFEDRGYRVWGARTMTSDPEWIYINVRRLFIYLEHSIDNGTQYAVFEPNGPQLWANITQSIEDFLLVAWRDGALLGDKPEQAYFVRCDRTTMTQNDLDNGRLICLIGVAPVKPAEFVIFRIGQWTADATV
jgi:phage tail sheath protein FI